MTERVSKNGLNHYDCEEDGESCAAFYNGIVAERIGKEDSRDPKEAGRHYFAEAESGWDFNPRFNGYCADYNPVDLNSNLYLYEKLFAEYEVQLGEGNGRAWENKAKARAEKMNELLWDKIASVYKDYNYVTDKCSDIVSAASFQPYFAGLAGEKQKDGLLNLLRTLESDWGIFTTAKTDKKIGRAHV